MILLSDVRKIHVADLVFVVELDKREPLPTGMSRINYLFAGTNSKHDKSLIISAAYSNRVSQTTEFAKETEHRTELGRAVNSNDPLSSPLPSRRLPVHS